MYPPYNVLAVEVHQQATNAPNMVFGSEVGLVRVLASETALRLSRSEDLLTMSWDGKGFTLQETRSLGCSNCWTDVPGHIMVSPYSVTNLATTTFYRLRD